MTAVIPPTGPEPIAMAGDATAATTSAHVTVSGEALAEVAELLQLCEDFLRIAPPTIGAELGFFLARSDTDRTAGWVLDRLGLQGRYLRARLATSRRHATSCPPPPPAWTATSIPGESR